MMVENAALYRMAGWSAAVALVALILSGVTIALFFGGAGAVFGPINDVCTAIALLALVLPILAVDRLAGDSVGAWLRVVTVAAVAGAILGAVGQLLLVAGVIDLETSFVTGGLGIIPVLVWVLAVVVLAFGRGVLPSSVGWLAAAMLALIVIGSAITAVTSGPASWLGWTALVVVLALWLGSLAASLLDRAATTA